MTIRELIQALNRIGEIHSYELNVYTRFCDNSGMIYQPDCAMVQEMDDCKMVILTNMVYEEKEDQLCSE